uniref:Hedgehog/Intein (Hint) domain-containing protein n=1 Tax=Pyramimonas orientalis virus TaxID=455367 RepID=A0A7M3UPE4_POV01|nr:hypothetical protein HWQ62_00500 [Pyramimonas orientalis virus]
MGSDIIFLSTQQLSTSTESDYEYTTNITINQIFDISQFIDPVSNKILAGVRLKAEVEITDSEFFPKGIEISTSPQPRQNGAYIHFAPPIHNNQVWSEGVNHIDMALPLCTTYYDLQNINWSNVTHLRLYGNKRSSQNSSTLTMYNIRLSTLLPDMTKFETILGTGGDNKPFQFKKLGTIHVSGTFANNTRGVIYETGAHVRGTVIYVLNGTLYARSGHGAYVDGAVHVSYTIPTNTTIHEILLSVQILSDSDPINRMDLWVDGTLVDSTTSTLFHENNYDTYQYMAGGDTGGTGRMYSQIAKTRDYTFHKTGANLSNGTINWCNTYVDQTTFDRVIYQGDCVFVIKVNIDTNIDDHFVLGLKQGETYNFIVLYGNEELHHNTDSNVTLSFTTLPPGEYELRVTGTFPTFVANAGGDAHKIVEVLQWGCFEWSSLVDAFADCINLIKVSAFDTPNLTNVTHMTNMFKNCTALSSINRIEDWGICNVTDMSGLLENTSNTMSYDQYNNVLNNWRNQNVQNGVNVHFGNAMYTSGYNDKQYLINSYQWTITDGGVVPLLCFLKGTHITTDTGDVVIEEINRDHHINGFKVHNITKTPLTVDYMVRFKANAFQQSVPSRDVVVTPVHGIYTSFGLYTCQYNKMMMANDMCNGVSIIKDYDCCCGPEKKYVYNVLLEDANKELIYTYIKASGLVFENLHPTNSTTSLQFFKY